MGSFTQRLARLEQAAPDYGARCQECGGQDPYRRRIASVSDAQPLRRCDECGSPVSRDGERLDGELRLKVIEFPLGASRGVYATAHPEPG
jgi:hypothetical protein